jgi:hypothetical protein
MPFAYERSRSCEAALMALSDRMFRWWSVDGSKSLARVVNDKHNKALPPNGAINVGWHSEHPTGTRYTLSVAADIDTQLRWLVVRRPVYLYSFSSALRELAAAALRRARFSQVHNSC